MVNPVKVLLDCQVVPPSLLYSIVPELTVAFTVTEFSVPPVQFDTMPVIVGIGFTVTVISLLRKSEHPVIFTIRR